MNERDVEAMFVRLSKLEKGKRQYTDTSNAERLLEKYGKDIRYCPEWNQWLCWDGKRWRKGRAVEMHARAKEIVRDMYGEACRAESEWEREELEKHAFKCEGIHRRKAMVEALSWEQPV